MGADATTRRRYRLDRGGMIRGRLVDDAGSPVTGARISIRPMDAPRPAVPLALNGSGEFRVPAGPGYVRVLISHPRYGLFRTDLQRVARNDTLDLGDCVLERERLLHLTALGPDGRPVPGATIVMLPIVTDPDPHGDPQPGDLTDAVAGAANAISVTTDEVGKATLLLAPGFYRSTTHARTPAGALAARAPILQVPRRGSRQDTPGMLDWTIPLQPVASLGGIARRFDDSVWAGALIRLVDVDSRFVAETRSALDGRFEFGGLAPGDYRVSIGSDGTTGHGFSQPVRLNPGDIRSAEHAAQTTSSTFGQLTHPDGTPAVGVRVVCGWLATGPEGDKTMRGFLGSAVSDEDGAFFLPDLPTDTNLALTVLAGPQWLPLYGFRSGESGLYRTRFQLMPGSACAFGVTGQVTEADGRTPRVGAAVSIERASASGEPQLRRVVLTDEAGHYSFDNLPPGAWQVAINEFGRAAEARLVHLRTNPQVLVVVAPIALIPAGWVAVDVRAGASGVPRTATVEIQVAGDDSTRQVHQAAVGTVTVFASLRRGATYRVVVRATGCPDQTTAHQVADADDRLRFNLRPTGD